MASRSGRGPSFRSLFSPRSRSASRTASEATIKRRRERRARRWRESFPRFSLSNWHSSAIVQTVCALFRSGAEATKAIQRATGSHYVGAGSYGRSLRIEGLEQRQMLTTTAWSLAAGDFSQTWEEMSMITAPDDWSGVDSIMGDRGDGMTSTTGVDPQTVLGASSNVVDVNANQLNPNTFTTGGVTEFHLGDPSIALSGSGTARAPHLLLYMDATGRQDVKISYRLRDLDASGDNSVQPIALHYRIGNSGSFTNVPAAFVSDASTGPNANGPDTSVVDISLPEWNNVADLQFRIMTTDAAGNDEWIGIDDITVTSNPLNTAPTFTSSATPSVNENSTAVVTLAATDAEAPPQIVSFSITDGDDKLRFTITDGNQLQFNAPPNYEAPTDANADNVYLVEVTASDGIASTVQQIAVTVLPLNDLAPTALANGPYTITEGDDLELSALGSADGDLGGVGATLSYAWNLDGLPGADFTTSSVTDTVPWSVLNSLGLNSAGSPYTISLTVSDGANTAVAAAQLVINAPPVGVLNLAGDEDSSDTLSINLAAGTYSLNGGPPQSLSGIATINFDGRGGLGSDALEISGGDFGTVNYNYLSANDGSIVLGGLTINYAGLEPISNDGDSDNAVFNLTNGADDPSLTDAGGGLLNLDGTSFEDTTFATPSTSVTINANDGDDTISVEPITGIAISIDGGTHTSGDTLSVDAQNNFAYDSGSEVRVQGLNNIGYTGIESVVLVNALATPDVVYVDDDWSSLSLGDDPDGPGGAVAFGVDAFASIEDAIAAVDVGGTVYVAAGDYLESLVIGKDVSVVGAGDGVVTVDADEAFTGILINSGFDVSISGITLTNFSSTGIQILGDLTLEDSTVDGGFTGIWVAGGTLDMDSTIVENALIFGVQVAGATTITGSEISAGATSAAAVIVSSFHAEITGSKLFGSQRGLLVNAAGTAEIHNSNLQGSSLRAVENSTATVVDASGNWWGSNTEAGVMAAKLGLVDFTPFLDVVTDNDGGARGFDGDTTLVHVTREGAQVDGGRIQEGIDLVSTGGTVLAHSGIYNEVAEIDHPLTLKSNSLHGAKMQPLTGSQQSVLIVNAPNVTIDGVEVQVNQDDDGGIAGTAPIAPVGISATPLTTANFDGLVIKNVKITSIGDNPVLSGADPRKWSGSPSLTVAAAGIVLYDSPSGGVPSIELTNNDVNITSGTSFFQRAVWLAQLNADITGNTFAGAANDLQFQFASGGSSLIENNEFRGAHITGGAGVVIADPNSSSPITIRDNLFKPTLSGLVPHTTSLQINYSGQGATSPILIEDNTFEDHNLGIEVGRADGVTIEGNNFTPEAGFAGFVHVLVDSNNASNSNIASPLIDTKIDNNTFNSALGSTGTAIVLQNDSIFGANYASGGVQIGVTANNIFSGDLTGGVLVQGGVATINDSISNVDTAIAISGGSVDITGSTLTGNTTGIELSGGSATLTGTGLTGNATGISVSGTGSLDLESGNAISGGTTGLVMSGANVDLVGNDLDNLSIGGTTGDYITLASGAFDGEDLDGTGMTLDGIAVSSMTPAQLFAAEDKITHEIDDASLGFILLQNDTIVVTPVITATTTDNDYLRIVNSIQAAANGYTILLGKNSLGDGVFNWDEPFALADWELGNDGVGGNSDDWGVQLPGNLNDVTITADPLDDIVIQGGGDLTTTSFEAGFIVYNNGPGATTNTGWEFSNFGIVDIDNAIGLYYSNGNNFSGLSIHDMYIRIPADNSTEPDDFQNIGIHYGAGQNISIVNNLIEIVGSGDADASTVAIQSNTHGGANYDGLVISGNQFVVLNSGDESITGIWENGHTHLSDITISGNTFTGFAGHAGDQTAFLVTSHSGASSTVTYSGNIISNVDVGIDWLDEYAGDPQNYTGTLPVVVSNNIMTGVGTGVRVGGVNASATLSGNSITGASGIGLDVLAGAAVVITSGSFQNLDTGIRVAGAAAISGVDFNSGVDNDTDLQILSGAGIVTLGAGNLFGGEDYFIDNASSNTFDLAALGYGAANYEGLAPGTLADAFTIEDRLRHKVDVGNASAGLIRVVAGNLYVTTPGTGASAESIQGAVNAASIGDTVNVESGTFVEDVTINVAGLKLLGAGPEGPGASVISGTMGPGTTSTIQVAASNVEVAGFTITREGNNTTDWDSSLNLAGVAVQGLAFTGLVLRDNLITGNRNGIDINNSGSHIIRNNRIVNNRTGMILRNQTDNLWVTENEIADNWTVGVLFLDASSGTNVPLQTATNSTFFNNDISGNWYGQVVDRQSGGALPAPGTTNLKNFSGNWFGSAAPLVSTANSTEPGYSPLIPVIFGGTSSPPGGQPDILGPASANIDFTAYLGTGTDTDSEYGFQGDFSNLHVTAAGAQTGVDGRITEAIGLATSTATIHIHAGTYADDLNAVGKEITFVPGASPGQIILNGSLTLDSDDTLELEIDGTSPATQFDNFVVTGPVSLGGATLSLSRGFDPFPGDSFTIIDNSGTISGTFNGLAEGGVVTVGGIPFTISYAGGDGNDVVLTVEQPNIVYVDADWVGTIVGNDPDAGGVATSFGYDSFATIQEAIDAVASGGQVIVFGDTYDETLLIDKALTLDAEADPDNLGEVDSILTVTSGVSQALIEVQASNVTIKDFKFNVLQPYATAGIYMFTNGTLGYTNLTIDNNEFTIAGPITVGGATSFVGFGTDSTAIAVHTANGTFSPTVTITDNDILPDNTLAPTAMFDRAIYLRLANGLVQGNTIYGDSHDLVAQFVGGGTLTVDSNQFLGKGGRDTRGAQVDFTEPESDGAVIVTNNTFTPFTPATPSGSNHVRSLMVKNNNSGANVVIDGNTFTAVSDVGLLLANAISATVTDNQFFAAAGDSDFVYVQVTNKVPTGGVIAANTLNATIQGNIFHEGTVDGGRAIEFLNHNSVGASFGSFVIGGAGALANTFQSGLDAYIYLDGSTGPSTSSSRPYYGGPGAYSSTTMAPFAVDLDAQLNKFGDAGSEKLPSAMTLAELFAAEDRIVHGPDNAALGLVTLIPGEVYVTTPGTGLTDETIQNAIDAADAGDTVHVQSGTFTENIVIVKDIDILGDAAGGTTLKSGIANTPLITVSGAGVFGADDDEVSIAYLNLDGDGLGSQGVYVEGTADLGTFSLANGDVKNFRLHGVLVNAHTTVGADPTVSALVEQVNLSDLDFTNNGITGGGGTADIQFFGFNNDAALTDITAVGSRVQNVVDALSTGARGGIQFRGVGLGTGVGVDEMGTVSLTNVDVSGDYRNQMIGFQRYTTVDDLTLSDVKLGGATSEITHTFGASLRFDGVGSGSLLMPALVDLGNTLFRGLDPASAQRHEIEFAPDNHFAFLRADGTSTQWTIGGIDVAAASLTLPQAFAVEDRILHYVDKLNPGHTVVYGGEYNGFVDIQTDKAFITDAADAGLVGDGSIQRGVDVVAAGGIVHVSAGSFNESVTINKHVAVIGAGSGASPLTNTVLVQPTGLNIITVTGSGASNADPLLLDSLRLTPDGVGTVGVLVPMGATVEHLKLNNLQVIGADPTGAAIQEIGFRIMDTADVDDLTITNSRFEHLTHGFITEKQLDIAGMTNVTNVVVTDSHFSFNQVKGIYAEKLSDATFTNVTADGNGNDGTFFVSGGGIELNLKGNVPTYENIEFNNLTVTNNATHSSSIGAGLLIKARGTGNDPSYAANAALLKDVRIVGGTFTGNRTAIRVGEPAPFPVLTLNNTSPTEVVIDGALISNSILNGIDLVGGETTVENTTLTNNPIGVRVVGSALATISGGNTISGSDTGIDVNTGTVLVEGTNLNGNDIGVLIRDGGVADLGQIGLGTNYTGLGVSTGGNDFSGYTLAADNTSGAIVNLNTGGAYSNAGPQGHVGPEQDVAAFNNLWAVNTPTGIENVVYHDADSAALGFIDYGTLSNLFVSLDVLPTETTNKDVNEGSSTTVYGEFDNDAQAHKVTVVWGDGSPNSVVVLPAGMFTFSITSPAGVTYKDDPNGPTQTINRAITVTVEEAATPANFLTDNSLSVDVNNVIPTASLSTLDGTLDEGESISVDVSAAFDPGTDTISAYRINWGDGTFDTYVSNMASIETQTHQYLDGLASPNVTITLDIFDDDGTWNSVSSLNVLVHNVPPSAGNFFSFDAVVSEGGTTTVFFVGPFTDPGSPDSPFHFAFDFNGNGIYGEAGEVGNGTYAGSGVASSAVVPASFLADDDDSPRMVNARIIDNDGGYSEYSVAIGITNVAPVVNAGADATAFAGVVFNHSVSFTDPGTDAPWSVRVDWNGDGDFLDANEGSFNVNSHTFNISNTYGVSDIGNTYNVVVEVNDNDGGVDTDVFQVTVEEDTFRVVSYETFASGFSVTFNRSPDLGVINLYDGVDAAIDLPDVIVEGDVLGTIKGSVAWDATTYTLTWVKTGGVLAADTYDITLISSSDAFKDMSSNLLDGDGDFDDSEVGDDFQILDWEVEVSTDRIVSMPDFARGAGQDVNVPATGLHLPIKIDNATGVTAVDVDVHYDPTLLTITGVLKGDGIPTNPLAGWAVLTNTVNIDANHAILKITISGATALSGTNLELLKLNAEVPNTAPYGTSQVIRLEGLRVNEDLISSQADFALHKAIYVGDADRDGAYGGTDAGLISRVVVGLDTGFDEHDWTDPRIAGDATGDGTISGLDASYIAQESVFIDVPEVPPLPLIPLTMGGAGIDPTYSVPEELQAVRGGTVVLPVSLEVLPAETVVGATFNVYFDDAVVDFVGIDTGPFWSSADNWNIIANPNVQPGRVVVSMFKADGPPSATGEGVIANLEFDVDSAAPLGENSDIDVNAANPNEGGLSWTPGAGSFVFTDLPGDYNRNGEVDAADYSIWRDTLGATVPRFSGADGNGDEVVDNDDYLLWIANFGNVLSGAGSGGAGVSPVAVEFAAPAPVELKSASAEVISTANVVAAMPSADAVHSSAPTSIAAAVPEHANVLQVTKPVLQETKPQSLDAAVEIIGYSDAGFAKYGRAKSVARVMPSQDLAIGHAEDLLLASLRSAKAAILDDEVVGDSLSADDECEAVDEVFAALDEDVFAF